MTNVISRYELIRILRVRFPKMWTKESELYDGRANAIWTGEGSYIQDEPLFNDMLDGGNYTMGVRNELVDALDQHGWFAEFANSGTVFIYPNE